MIITLELIRFFLFTAGLMIMLARIAHSIRIIEENKQKIPYYAKITVLIGIVLYLISLFIPNTPIVIIEL